MSLRRWQLTKMGKNLRLYWWMDGTKIVPLLQDYKCFRELTNFLSFFIIILQKGPGHPGDGLIQWCIGEFREKFQELSVVIVVFPLRCSCCFFGQRHGLSCEGIFQCVEPPHQSRQKGRGFNVGWLFPKWYSHSRKNIFVGVIAHA